MLGPPTEGADGHAVGDRLAELDRLAPQLLSKGRVDIAVGPELGELLGLEFRDHPWAKLVVATALNDLRDDRAEVWLADGLRSFMRQQDKKGMGYAEWTLGNRALGGGQLEEAAQWYKLARGHLDSECQVDAACLAHLGLEAYQRGELRQAIAITEEALALTRMRGSRRYEGVACLYLAFFAVATGAFGRADTLLTVAEEAFRELTDPYERYEFPLILAGQGVVAALRGQADHADERFALALKTASEIKVSWYVAITLVLRAEFTAWVQPTRSLADARNGLEQLITWGDVWWQTWALRAQGVAARETGDLEASVQVLRHLLARDLNPMERGVALLALGETIVRTDHPGEAVPVLNEARGLLEPLGARYWVVRCWIALAEVGPRRAERRRRALALADDDLAYRHLLIGRSTLRITMLGDAAVWLGNERLRFPTHKAELAIFALALAGSAGMHEDVLLDRLWHGAPADRARGRLRTLLWQIRRVLGREAWRLERRGDTIRLDLGGVEVDVLVARCRASSILVHTSDNVDVASARRLVEELSQPFMHGWQYEDWVEAEARYNAGLAARIRGSVDLR